MNQYSLADIETFCARYYGALAFTLLPYGYTQTFTALAQGTQQSANLSIVANADFMLTALAFRASLAAQNASQTQSIMLAPFVRVLLTDGGSNQQMTNQSVDLNNYMSGGGANFFRRLPYPRVISGRSTLQIQVTNYAAFAESYNIDLFFEGVQVYAFDDGSGMGGVRSGRNGR